MAFYPKLPSDLVMSLEIVTRSLTKDPNYLTSGECPYPAEVKEYLLRAGTGPMMNTDIFEGLDDLDVIDKQIQRVLSDLEGMSASMIKAETSEKIAYFKAKTTLLEKLVSLKERVFNLKEIAQFRDTLMTFLDMTCTKDQVSDFVNKLDGALGVGGTAQ